MPREGVARKGDMLNGFDTTLIRSRQPLIQSGYNAAFPTRACVAMFSLVVLSVLPETGRPGAAYRAAFFT
jgi:hypothetical protein